MRFVLLFLLTAFSPGAPAQDGHAAPFGEEHAQEKRLERIAIGLRVERNLTIARERNEVRYAENRSRCQAALRVAELCGKFSGTFSCNEHGFQPIPAGRAVKPPARDDASRYRMQRCALDAARHGP